VVYLRAFSGPTPGSTLGYSGQVESFEKEEDYITETQDDLTWYLGACPPTFGGPVLAIKDGRYLILDAGEVVWAVVERWAYLPELAVGS